MKTQLLFLILSNTAALLAFLFVSISIQSFRNQIAIEYITCPGLYCSRAKQIKEILVSLSKNHFVKWQPHNSTQ